MNGMHALRWTGIGKIEMQELDIPKIQDHEVLIKVKSAAICGTDLHMVRNGASGIQLPLTLGHEFSGEIAVLGSNVNHLSLGQRVAVEPIRICHHCDYCESGNYDLCDHFEEAGFTYDGGMGE